MFVSTTCFRMQIWSRVPRRFLNPQRASLHYVLRPFEAVNAFIGNSNPRYFLNRPRISMKRVLLLFVSTTCFRIQIWSRVPRRFLNPQRASLHYVLRPFGAANALIITIITTNLCRRVCTARSSTVRRSTADRSVDSGRADGASAAARALLWGGQLRTADHGAHETSLVSGTAVRVRCRRTRRPRAFAWKSVCVPQKFYFPFGVLCPHFGILADYVRAALQSNFCKYFTF